MTTVCWTVIHHATAPIRQGAARVAHVVGRSIRHTGQAAHHATSGAAHRRVWFEVVCKVIPAAVAGGGLLVPHPANPPLPRQPQALVWPAPAVPSGLPWNGRIPPTVAAKPFAEPPAAANVPEPSTAGLLLVGAGGLVLIRFTGGLIRPRSP
jgi:hypothetical protein